METVLFVLLGFSLGLAVLPLWRKAEKRTTTRYQKAPFLTDNEREFFWRMCKALPGTYIFPKVAASALLEPKKSARERRNSEFGEMSRKLVDFVICDAGLKLLCVVQLDDGTGEHNWNRKIDQYFSRVGIKTIRWQSNLKPSFEQIGKAILPMADRPPVKPHIVSNNEMNTVQMIYESDPVPSNINGLTLATLEQLTPNKVLKNSFPHIWQRICLFAPEPKHLQKYMRSLSIQDRGEKRTGFSADALKEISDIQFENDRFFVDAVTGWQTAFVNR